MSFEERLCGHGEIEIDLLDDKCCQCQMSLGMSIEQVGKRTEMPDGSYVLQFYHLACAPTELREHHEKMTGNG